MDISRRSFIVGGTAAVSTIALSSALSGCKNDENTLTKSGLKTSNFESEGIGTLDEALKNEPSANEPTKLYTITNKNGAELCLTNVGARIVSLMIPGKDGKLHNMVISFKDIKSYVTPSTNTDNYYGAVVGRYANRIKNGQFNIAGNKYQIDVNEKGNTLHGGKFGMHFQAFKLIDFDKNKMAKFELIEPDGHMGFPGNFKLQVTYTLNDNNTVGFYCEASCDKATPVNIANHAFWDVSGDPKSSITNDRLFICSKQTTAIDDKLIPTGEITNTKTNDPFDFLGEKAAYFEQGKQIGKDLNSHNQQILLAQGYDHNFAILDNKQAKNEGIDFDGKFEIDDDGSDSLQGQARIHAKFQSDLSGIEMTIVSNEIGLQFYDGHGFKANVEEKDGVKLDKYAAIALEPQHYPDSPNHENFPNTILEPGKTFKTKSEYKFKTL